MLLSYSRSADNHDIICHTLDQILLVPVDNTWRFDLNIFYLYSLAPLIDTHLFDFYYHHYGYFYFFFCLIRANIVKSLKLELFHISSLNFKFYMRNKSHCRRKIKNDSEYIVYYPSFSLSGIPLNRLNCYECKILLSDRLNVHKESSLSFVNFI